MEKQLDIDIIGSKQVEDSDYAVVEKNAKWPNWENELVFGTFEVLILVVILCFI